MFPFLKLIKFTVLFYSASYDQSEMAESLKSKSLNLTRVGFSGVCFTGETSECEIYPLSKTR